MTWKALRTAPLAKLVLAMASVDFPALARAFGEIRRVVSVAIAKTVVPLLPLYILTVVADLTGDGAIALIADRFYRKSGRQAGRAA